MPGSIGSADTFGWSVEHGLALARDDVPTAVTGFFQVVVAAYRDVDKILDALRTGKGLGWGDHHPELFGGVERFFRLKYQSYLTTEWNPALDGIDERLRRGDRVADAGCGHGASTLIMLLVEPFAQDRLEDNLTPVGRVFYSASTMFCTPASLNEDGAALGAQAGEARLRSLFEQAGYLPARRGDTVQPHPRSTPLTRQEKGSGPVGPATGRSRSGIIRAWLWWFDKGCGMRTEQEDSAPPDDLGRRWQLRDVVVVLALVFVLHRILVHTLAGPVLWWLYYPALWVAVTVYLLDRGRFPPTGLSPRLLSARTALVAVLAAMGFMGAFWAVASGSGYILDLIGEAPYPDIPWWVPMRAGGLVAFPVMIVAVTAGPFVEEYIFRGVMYAALLERTRAGWAAVLSSAAFAALHGPSKVGITFGFGLVAAAIYRRTGSLLAAVITHATLNGLLLLAVALIRLTGLHVSPVWAHRLLRIGRVPTHESSPAGPCPVRWCERTPPGPAAERARWVRGCPRRLS